MEKETAIEESVTSLVSGQSQNSVHNQLLDSGFAPDEAEEILQTAIKLSIEVQVKQKRRQELPYRLAGLGLLACGIGMLIYSYTSAKSGGVYLVPGGLIGYGLYMFATGTGKV